ncbi:MAG: FtsX-like permease family protein [Acidimicrobiales bacterium]
MSAVWRVVRPELTRRRWSSTALALVLALGAGVVIAAVAGARRTDSAMDRFVAFSRPEDAYVQAADGATAEKVAELPQVADATRFPFVFLTLRPDGADSGDLASFAAADRQAFRTLDRVLVVQGRMAQPDDPGEVDVNELAARRLHLGLGSRLTLHSYSIGQMLASATRGTGPPEAPAGPTVAVRVVGIVRAPADVNPQPSSGVVYQGQEVLAMTPAFLRSYAAALGVAADDLPGMEGMRVRLRQGRADIDAFTAAARPLIGPEGQVLTGSDTAAAAGAVNRATHFQAVALLGFAGLAALTTLLIVGQAMARQVALDAADGPTLRAMGMTTGQRALAAVWRSALVAVVGALLAPAVALGLSPLFPIGLARQAEIHPGFSADLPVLLLGALGALVLVAGRCGVAAWRAARGAGQRGPVAAADRRSRLADALNRAGLPAPATTGVRMSLERGSGGSTVPVRGAMVAVITAVCGVVAALVLATSLDTLAADPRQQGWNWDVMAGNPNSQGDVAATAVPALAANPHVGAFAGLIPLQPVRLAGHQVDGIAVDAEKGGVYPTVVEGREPMQPDEALVAGASLRAIGRRVGDIVDARAGDRSMPMRVVGRAVLPTTGALAGESMNKGVVMTAAGARQLFPDLDTPKVFVVRYAPGADRRAARASVETDFPRLVLGFSPSGEVENLRRVRGLPVVLAGLLVVLGGAVMAHALVTTIRRRRRDLAVLKALGFVRGQVTATVAWQATTLAVVALVVGLPLGVAAGRWGWALVVNQLGSRSGAVVPRLAVGLTALCAVAAANVVAAGPAWAAARLRPAGVLRTE